MIENIRKSGAFIIADLVTWDGPEEAGQQGRYIRNSCRFPVVQDACKHPRHPQGHSSVGDVCVSPSMSGYKDLVKHMKFPVRKTSKELLDG